MDPALAILDRALKGDVGALSFLERTASIYVFDGTNPGQPKICGAWDFLSQALTEVERYEARAASIPASHLVNLDGHVQLLSTMSTKAARRSPVADQKLVEVCLTNASYHGSTEQAHHLININSDMREREMGRLAAMVFDFSNHLHPHHQNRELISYQSAFCNPIAMESLCAVVAANAISNGPHDFVNFVTSWIVPSIDNLPPYAVASVTCHLAAEAVGKNSPLGIRDVLKNQLFEPVVMKVLAPMLQEAVRESDHNDAKAGGRVKNQRIASMVFKGIERWSSVASCSLVRLSQVCKNANVNIIEVISDAMYSDSEMMVDALAEFLDNILRKQTQDEAALQSLAIVSSMMNGPPAHLDQLANEGMAERQSILSELISAVGLQRLRVNERLENGDTGVCRCLSRIARSITVASQHEIKSGKFNGADSGFIELLIKSVRHPSINVCAISLEALILIITPRSNLSIKLLPLLQGKAIVPPSLVSLTSGDDCDVDYHEFERFREHLLTEVLIACYRSNRSYYIESCTCAIEEFCSNSCKSSSQTAYQLEAALFCLSAVSIDASKRSLLLGASPAAQEAAAKACKVQSQESIEAKDIHEDAKKHDESLGRTLRALCNAPQVALLNPLFLSQMCRFIGKYAKWICQTPSDDLLNSAASIAHRSFEQAVTVCTSSAELLSEISISPIADAVSSLRNLLSRSPHRFTSSEALSTLEKGWKLIYDSSNISPNTSNLEDKKALSIGITRVISVLPQEQWQVSLLSLTSQPIGLIENFMKIADQMSSTGGDMNSIPNILEKIADEILVLAIIIRTFNSAIEKNKTDAGGIENSSLAVLEQSWPYLDLLASAQNSNEILFSSLGELLSVAVSMSGKTNNILLLQKIDELMKKMIDSTSKSNDIKALHPIMELVCDIIDTLGPLAGFDASDQKSPGISNDIHTIRDFLKQVTARSFYLLQALNSDSQVDLLPKMFSICTLGIQRCPFLFLTVQDEKKMLSTTITMAYTSIDQKHTDVSRAALLYLKEVLLECSRESIKYSNNHITDYNKYILDCKSVLAPLLEDLVMKIIYGACGHFSRELLDPSASVLNLILKDMNAANAERVVKYSTTKEFFRLGNEGERIFISTLGKCAKTYSNLSLMMEIIEDLWTIHQTYSSSESVVDGDCTNLKVHLSKYIVASSTISTAQVHAFFQPINHANKLIIQQFYYFDSF